MNTCTYTLHMPTCTNVSSLVFITICSLSASYWAYYFGSSCKSIRVWSSLATQSRVWWTQSRIMCLLWLSVLFFLSMHSARTISLFPSPLGRVAKGPFIARGMMKTYRTKRRCPNARVVAKKTRPPFSAASRGLVRESLAFETLRADSSEFWPPWPLFLKQINNPKYVK